MRPIVVHLTQEQIELIFGVGIVKDCWAILNEEDRSELFGFSESWSSNGKKENHVFLNDCDTTFIEFTNGVVIEISISEWGFIKRATSVQ